MNRKLFKDFAILLGVIIIAAIGARIMAGGETLEDYANKNPETAGIASSDAGTNASTASVSSQSSSDSSASSITSEASSTSEASESTSVTLPEPSEPSPDRVTYQEGFYYEPIPNDVFRRISGISYPVDCTVPLSDLSYVVVQYMDFNGESQRGELICNKDLAQDMVEIFYELYTSGYQVESIKLVDEFDGDDTASMLANNTSCFNYRVVEGTTKLSNHAYGRAIDINPFYNPYVTYKKDGTTKISPEGSEPYADRDAEFPYKIDENDLAYKLFNAHGFKWGGDWNSSKDYQHFEKK